MLLPVQPRRQAEVSSVAEDHVEGEATPDRPISMANGGSIPAEQFTGTGSLGNTEENEQSDAVVIKTPRNTTRRTVKIHSAPLPVVAPTSRHDSWDAWVDYLKDYQARTYQVIAVSETMNCGLRNKKLASTKAAQQGKQIMYVPTDWKVYQRTYICTHGWPVKDRGVGIRPKRFLRSAGCPFRFVVQMNFDDHWFLEVKNGVFEHNHAVGPQEYKTYTGNRGVHNDAIATEADAMIRFGCKRSKIYEYLLEHGENVIQKDVDNMVQAFKTASKHDKSDDDACSILLAEFSAHDGNTVTVDETSATESGVINLSSRHMRTMFNRFPELLLVDCTHKTNTYNYQLCTLMIIDEHGEGQPIQQSLLERNSDWHMACTLDHLLRVNPVSSANVEVIMVDKDLNEIRVLQSYFPHARILLCAFHVIKYLGLASRKPDYGKLSNEDHEDLDAIVHNMVYAATKLTYDENHSSLKAFCMRLNLALFYSYFEKNWNNCTEKWVMYERASLPHFQVHTNNHLENWFGHFKKIVKPEMIMKECVEAVIGCDKRAENEYLHRCNRVGARVNRMYDADMSQVLRFTTHFVAEHVEKQYVRALAKYKQFVYDTIRTPGYVFVKHKYSEYAVNTETYDCECPFATSMKLPCQHAMAYRKFINSECCVPLSRIHDRWMKGGSKIK